MSSRPPRQRARRLTRTAKKAVVEPRDFIPPQLAPLGDRAPLCAEWVREMIRHPSFKGVREDKDMRQVRREGADL
jgi:hypothetical protein